MPDKHPLKLLLATLLILLTLLPTVQIHASTQQTTTTTNNIGTEGDEDENPYLYRYRPLRAGIQIAMPMPNYNDGRKCSIGYPAYYSISFGFLEIRFYGFVTAGRGHCYKQDENPDGEVYQPTISYNNYVGNFSIFPNNNTVDAAFVFTEGGICWSGSCSEPETISNLIQYGYLTRTIGGYMTDSELLEELYYLNATVWKAGRTTGTTEGHIRPVRYRGTEPIFIDVIKCAGAQKVLFHASYYAAGGDSGGTVYTYHNGLYIVLGIHDCGLGTNSYAVPVTSINPQLGIQGYK